MTAGASEEPTSEMGGVFGISEVGLTLNGGGPRPRSPLSFGFNMLPIEGSSSASWINAVRGTFGGAGAGLGLASILAQLRVPSGFELGTTG